MTPCHDRPRRLNRALVAILLAFIAALPAQALPLWEIAGERNRIVIVGSIHFLRPGRDALPARIISAYDAADVLVMEIDLDGLDPAATQATVQRLGIDPQRRTLDVLLGPRAFGLASDKARVLGIDLALLRPMEPWLAAITITQSQLQRLGFAADAGVEQQLLARAQRDGKEVRGLETLERQLAALDGLSESAQRTFLLETLDESALMEAKIDDIVAAWRTGDLARMEQEFLDSVAAQPELYRRVVVERNRNWARQIGAMKRDSRDYLVVVGTLHLVGPDSLIRQLGAADAR
jgi:uncharacterized protein YbaP (TraB family)